MTLRHSMRHDIRNDLPRVNSPMQKRTPDCYDGRVVGRRMQRGAAGPLRGARPFHSSP